MNIAIIPARGGSKRIARKNIRLFCGRPMIGWPIAAALKSGLFEKVVVSTDDEEIAACARDFGAQTPFMRPAELADDHTGTSAVIAHALHYAQEAGWPVDAACCLYATAAFVQPEDLAAAQKLLSPGCDFAFPALRYSHPPQRGFRADDLGAPQLLYPEHRATRTQDLPAIYHDAGQFYWGTRVAWLEEREFFGPRTQFIEISPLHACDIDTPEDWALAERLFIAGGRDENL